MLFLGKAKAAGSNGHNKEKKVTQGALARIATTMNSFTMPSRIQSSGNFGMVILPNMAVTTHAPMQHFAVTSPIGLAKTPSGSSDYLISQTWQSATNGKSGKTIAGEPLQTPSTPPRAFGHRPNKGIKDGTLPTKKL